MYHQDITWKIKWNYFDVVCVGAFFFIKLVKLEELDLRQTLNPIRLNLLA
jgi:hypothetical protein